MAARAVRRVQKAAAKQKRVRRCALRLPSLVAWLKAQVKGLTSNQWGGDINHPSRVECACLKSKF